MRTPPEHAPARHRGARPPDAPNSSCQRVPRWPWATSAASAIPRSPRAGPGLLIPLSGLLLAGLAVVLGRPFVASDPTPADADVALVARFYAAANALLAGADPGVLTSLLDPTFIAHDSDGALYDGAGLATQLAAVGASSPGVRLQPAPLAAGAGWVAVQVRAAGGAPVPVPLVDAPPATAMTELLQVRDARIVGYWSAGLLATMPRSLPPLPLAPASEPALFVMARGVAAPGAVLADLVAPGPQLLLGERGRLSIQPLGAAAWFVAAQSRRGWQTTTPTGQTLLLTPGDALLVPAGARWSERNLSDEPAATLRVAIVPTAALYGTEHHPVPVVPDAVAMFNPGRQGAWTAWAPGVAIAVVASGPLAAGSTTPMALTIARLSLAPGAAIPAHAVVGCQLVAVAPAAWVDSAASKAERAETGALSGQGLASANGRLPAIRNLGTQPLPLTVATLQPVDAAIGRSSRPTGPVRRSARSADARPFALRLGALAVAGVARLNLAQLVPALPRFHLRPRAWIRNQSKQGVRWNLFSVEIGIITIHLVAGERPWRPPKPMAT